MVNSGFLNWVDYAEQQGFLKQAQSLSLQEQEEREFLPAILEKKREEFSSPKKQIQISKLSPEFYSQQTSKEENVSPAEKKQETSSLQRGCRKIFLN